MQGKKADARGIMDPQVALQEYNRVQKMGFLQVCVCVCVGVERTAGSAGKIKKSAGK